MSRIDDLQLSKVCVALQSDDRNKRKKSLEDFHKCLITFRPELRISDYCEIWKIVNKQLSRCLIDSAESCRYTTVELWKEFLYILPNDERDIAYLFPILSRRLSSQELHEPSEEVRLNYIVLLRLVVKKYTGNLENWMKSEDLKDVENSKSTKSSRNPEILAAYVSDLVDILARTVTDKCPAIKRESCDCISELARSMPPQFYSRSESLIKPVLSNFAHQHWKVRVASIETIGEVMQYGNGKSLDQVTTPLAERLFDQSGAVRLAVIQVAGRWLIELRDRYSWWHKLIPLLVTGLHDDIENVRNRASILWNNVGLQYMKENENDERLKDKMDFLNDKPDHYPPNLQRPNLGCRVIVQQNLCKLVGGIARELGDWLVDIRIRSAQLLCVLVVNAEQDVTQHIEKLLPAMYRACNDQDNRVATNVELASEYMGYFVPPNIYSHLVIPTLEENITAGHLRVFGAIIRGTESKSLLTILDKIGQLLRQPHVCRSKKFEYQRQLLRCCESVIDVSKKDCVWISEDLFVITFTVLSLRDSEEIEEMVINIWKNLARVDEFFEMEKFVERHLRVILESLSESSAGWSIHSGELLIFRECLLRATCESTKNFDIVLTILRNSMNIESEPELRLKLFITVCEYFARDNTNDILLRNYCKFLASFLRDILMPGIVWSAGKTSEAIRTAAVCCLCALLERRSVDETNSSSGEQDFEDIANIFEKIMPILVSLTDDNAKKTRLYALRAICLIFENDQRTKQFFSPNEQRIHDIYPHILKRLDDGCDDVRKAAIATLVVVWRTKTKNYDLVFNRSHVDFLYTSTIVHLDDPDVNFQSLMLGALMELCEIHPEFLAKKIENSIGNFRNKNGLECLLKKCHELLREMS